MKGFQLGGFSRRLNDQNHAGWKCKTSPIFWPDGHLWSDSMTSPGPSACAIIETSHHMFAQTQVSTRRRLSLLHLSFFLSLSPLFAVGRSVQSRDKNS